MNKVILIVGFIFIIQSVFCQTQIMGDWMVNVNTGVEAHDKRLFNYSERESLLANQPEFWGTYHLGLQFQRMIFSEGHSVGMLGVGFTFEKATFDRPFNHLYFNEDNFFILRHQNNYNKYKVPISFVLFFEINERWSFNGAINSHFLLFRSIGRVSYSEPTPYKEATFDFFDINATLGINYNVKNILFGVRSRLLNFQKIDKIIFNTLIRDPRTNQTWEWHNPLRFDLTIGYTW